MIGERIEILDTADADAVAAYERGFYTAFRRTTSNTLVRTLWNWDDAAGRLATRIPYSDQLVFLSWDSDGKLQGGMGFNVTLREYQSAAFGFAPPDERAGVCEALTLFAIDDGSLGRALRFWRGCWDRLRERGFHAVYGTCAPGPLTTYRNVGGEVLETRTINGELRHLLRFDLSRRAMRPPSTDAVASGDVPVIPRLRVFQNLS